MLLKIELVSRYQNNTIQRIKVLCLWSNNLYLKSQYCFYKSKELLPFMRIFENIRAQRAFNLLDKQRFDQIEKKKITELKNTLQNC